jgi:hypothetical protein
MALFLWAGEAPTLSGDFLHVGQRFCTLAGMAIVVGAIDSAYPSDHFPKVGVPSNSAAGTWEVNHENAHFLFMFMVMQFWNPLCLWPILLAMNYWVF